MKGSGSGRWNTGNKGIIQTGGSISAQNLGVGESVTINSNGIAKGLGDELNELKSQIATLPVSQAEIKATLEVFRAALESEAVKKSVNKHFWNITSEGFVNAAKAVSTLAPTILASAERVAGWFQ